MARQWANDGDKINWGDITLMDSLTTATMACWVRVDDWTLSDNYGYAWRKANSFVPLQRDPLGGTGNADHFGSVISGDANGFVAGSSYTWTEDVWHFAAVTFDGGTDTLSIYASLADAASLTTAGTASVPAVGGYIGDSTSSMFNFGNGADSTEDVQCTLAHLGMFNVVLSEADLKTYRDNPTGFDPASRVFFCELPGGSPESDIEGGASGTVTGTNIVSGPPLGSGAVPTLILSRSNLRW